MPDQVNSMIRDSDIKFECRLLLTIISIMKLPPELAKELLEPIGKIVELENKRLNGLAEEYKR